jgi:purine-cytosine permease-like protein
MDSSAFNPPIRRSMTDAQLHEALGNAQADEAGITAAMELLETQAQLRDIEKMEFSAWVLDMERIGSPEALLAVENAKRAQQGLEPLTALPQAAPAVEDVVANLNNLYAAATPAAEPVVEPVVEAAAPTESEPVSEPTYDYVSEPIQIIAEEVIAELAPNNELDEFERLLAADTVVGAEDELTALEEELAPQVARDEIVLIETDPGIEFEAKSAVERVSTESEAKVSRRSKANSQFWAWLGISGSVVPLGLAWFLNSIGIAFTQAVAAVFVGTLASALLIAIGALGGKRSGLPTLVLSRAAFGVRANAVPGIVLTLVRFFWSIALIAIVVVSAKNIFAIEDVTAVARYSTNEWLALASVVLIIAAAVAIAIFGGRVLFRAQQVSGLIGLTAVITLAIAVGGVLNLEALLAQPSSSFTLMLTAAILTFSVSGLAWASAGADYARKLSISTRGAAVIGYVVLALSVIPTAVTTLGLIILGSLKPLPQAVEVFTFASLTASGENVLSTFGQLLAPWLGYVLLASAILTVIVSIAMSLYSSNLSLHSLGAKLKPAIAQPLLGAVFLALACYGLVRLGEAGVWFNLAGYAMVAAVPVAAWAGIFAADILIRRIAYHEVSLSRSYGFYKSINVINLLGWLLATAVGLGLVRSELVEFSWTGYLSDYFVNSDFWQLSSAGVIIALAIGLLLPVIFGIPRIKRQESEVLAIEARRDDLKDIFGLGE